MPLQTVQPVYIRSKHNGGFLSITSPRDSSRNGVYVIPVLPACTSASFSVGVNVGVASFSVGLPMGPDASIENAKWTLIPNGQGQHQIMNMKYNEPLYAAADDLAYNKDCRNIFTWRPHDNDHGCWRNWILEQTNNGYYTIKHENYGEYLFAADRPSTGYVFTWRQKDLKSLSDKFYWQLMNA